MSWFQERLYTEHLDKGYAQRFRIARVVARARSAFQRILVFDTPRFGRVLALDGVVQTTEADEFVYHEMLAHVPILAHGRVRDVLIIGGGDGGALREVLRHKTVRRAVMVEIDGAVVRLAARHMPKLNGGAFADRRADVLIADGIDYVKKAKAAAFDLIIVDSTDPLGPGEVLFTDDFYRHCRRVLRPRGLVVTQNGVPFFQPNELRTTRRRLGRVFADVAFFGAVVPSYVGGWMTLAWASDFKGHRDVPERTLARRFRKAGLRTRYYTPGLHKAAFQLPAFIGKLAGKA